MRTLSLVALVALGFASASSGGESASEPASFGTAHPSMLHAADPAGRWIVACQARADTDGDGRIVVLFDSHHRSTDGDALHPYLVIGGGEGTAIGELLAVDPRSRYVVGRPEGRVVLYDTQTGSATDLASGADAGSVAASVEPWVSFDDAGRLVVFSRARGAAPEAVA